MIKAWLSMWKKTFCYTAEATRKEYWQALIMNVIAMYVGIIPYTLILANFTDNVAMIAAVYLIAAHLPVLALYFRRARGAGWKLSTTVWLAITIPVLSGLIVGVLDRCGAVERERAMIGKILALSFGLFLYGSIITAVSGKSPEEVWYLPIGGLLLASGTLIVYGIRNWRAVVAVLLGRE